MKVIFLICGCLMSLSALAQELELTPLEEVEGRVETLESETSRLNNLKVSGYVQAQYQWGEQSAVLKTGGPNEDPAIPYSRIGIRRGRIKFAYEEGIASGVFQLDITEKGVAFKDVYLNIKDPWFQSMALRAGIFDRPFGFEIAYSSSRRESPERATVIQTLFPDERDLGAMLVLQAPKTSPWSILKLEAGLFAGNGIKRETDNRRDFIGHLSLAKTIGNTALFGAGISYYGGYVYQGTNAVYTMQGDSFVSDDNPADEGRFAKREYIGFDAQFSVMSLLGMTQLRAEYLFGRQPAAQGNSKSPNSNDLPDYDMYIRNFNGGYVIFIQDIGSLPFSAVLKYDWYNPNIKIKGDAVGLNNTGKADLSQSTLGVGGLWRINKSLRLQTYYEFNWNEKSMHVAGMEKNLKADVFTLRLQYKF